MSSGSARAEEMKEIMAKGELIPLVSDFHVTKFESSFVPDVFFLGDLTTYGIYEYSALISNYLSGSDIPCKQSVFSFCGI